MLLISAGICRFEVSKKKKDCSVPANGSALFVSRIEGLGVTGYVSGGNNFQPIRLESESHGPVVLLASPAFVTNMFSKRGNAYATWVHSRNTGAAAQISDANKASLSEYLILTLSTHEGYPPIPEETSIFNANPFDHFSVPTGNGSARLTDPFTLNVPPFDTQIAPAFLNRPNTHPRTLSARPAHQPLPRDIDIFQTNPFDSFTLYPLHPENVVGFGVKPFDERALSMVPISPPMVLAAREFDAEPFAAFGGSMDWKAFGETDNITSGL